MFKLVVVLCCFAAALGDTLDGKIVGGLPADISQFPYQVSFRKWDEHICGGSILNKNTVLTAAHCTDENDIDDLSIRVGNTNNKLGKQYNIRKIYQHTEYNRVTYNNDISILKISTNIEFSATVQPISIIGQGKDVTPGTTAVVSGWGDTFENDPLPPDNLRMVYLTLISDNSCKSVYGSRITGNMFCAYTPMKDSCQGDSGGPFVQGGVQIGVVSWGVGCARPSVPGVYTKLSNFNKWVQQYL